MRRQTLPAAVRRRGSQRRQVVLDGRRLEYTLTYKKVKNINLRIGTTGGVQLSAPSWVAPEETDRLVLSKWSWIERALDRRRLTQCRETAAEGNPPEQIAYLGGLLPVTCGAAPSGEKSAVRLEEGRLIVALNPTDRALTGEERLCRMDRLLTQWRLDESRRVMEPVCRRYFAIFESLGCRMPLLRFRQMKSQWGSYNRRTHVVTLNTRLLAYPMACVEYVVLHELTHMLYPDHQQGFHRFMASTMPDYRERRARLRTVLW